MNIQIEHLENHTARLTVDVDPDRLTQAMQKAARRIGQKVNIPGFRKGKAPYNIILKWVGEQAVMEEALDGLGNEVYREALEESKIVAYAPGNLENVKTDAGLQLTFTLSKQPEVTLGAYREVRLPFTAVEVTDEAVNQAMRRMQEQRALIEPAHRPARLEDLVKAKVFGEVIHPEKPEPKVEPALAADAAQSEASAAAADATATTATADAAAPDATADASPTTDAAPATATADATAVAPADTAAQDEADQEPNVETFVDEEMEIALTDDEAHDMLPGFSAHVVGMNAGEEKSFSLTFPDDYKEQRYAGHTFNLRVSVQEVKSRILPVLSDDFAKQVTDNEVDNLLDLRIRVRKNLQESAEHTALEKYSDSMLDEILKQSEVHYPEEMVKEFTDDILKTLDENLRQQGLSLNRLMQVQNKDEAALRADYRDMAIQRIKRTLILGELLKLEQISVSDEELNNHLDLLTAQYSKDADEASNFRKMLNRPETRRQIVVDLMMHRLNERLAAIGKGENPAITPIPEAEEESTAPESASADGAAPVSASPQVAVPEDTSPASAAPEVASADGAAPESSSPVAAVEPPAALPTEPAEPAEKTE